jgi:hypothetical protein
MKLNQRAAFALGVGFGSQAMARLGIWPLPEDVTPTPPASPSTRPASGSVGRSPRRRVEEDEALLLILLR